MNWDRGFKRLYIALTVLFFIALVTFNMFDTRTKKAPCTKDTPYLNCWNGWTYATAETDLSEPGWTQRVDLTFSERLPETLKNIGTGTVIWAIISSLWFLIRWVLLGFKKTSTSRNWPEGPDE